MQTLLDILQTAFRQKRWLKVGCRKQEGMQMTTDVRKALGEKTKLEREKATAKEEAERKALLEVGTALPGNMYAYFAITALPGNTYAYWSSQP